MIYVALMMMPFQVMMLSNYLVLDQMKLLDHLWGIILPAAFFHVSGFYHVSFL